MKIVLYHNENLDINKIYAILNTYHSSFSNRIAALYDILHTIPSINVPIQETICGFSISYKTDKLIQAYKYKRYVAKKIVISICRTLYTNIHLHENKAYTIS